MLDSKMCPVHGLFLPPLSHIPSLLNHLLVHLRIYAPSRKCFRFSHFSFSLSLRFSVIIQFKGLRIYCLAPGLQVSVSPSVLVSLLFIFSQTRIIPGRYAQIDVRSDTRFVFSGTNPRSLLFLLNQGSPSPISIYSSLGHVNTFIITSTYLFIYRIMILRIEKEKHILRCPETGVTVCWSWMSGPSLTNAVRP